MLCWGLIGERQHRGLSVEWKSRLDVLASGCRDVDIKGHHWYRHGFPPPKLNLVVLHRLTIERRQARLPVLHVGGFARVRSISAQPMHGIRRRPTMLSFLALGHNRSGGRGEGCVERRIRRAHEITLHFLHAIADW